MTEEQIAKTQLNQAQQQIDNDPNAVYASNMRDERTANLLEQINPDNLLTDIEHRIRGEKKNVYTQQWEKISKDQKQISEKLVSNFMSFLGAILNQNTSMSNFSSDEINSMMEMIIRYISKDLTVNDEEYDIVEDYTEMDRISIIICTTCFATLKQAMNGSLSRRVFSTMKLNGNLNDDKKPGYADALAFWK
jgi:hypothetical protein